MPQTLIEQYLGETGRTDEQYELFGAKKAMEYLFPKTDDKIHRNTLYKMCRRGQLGHLHMGTHFKFYRKHLDEVKKSRFGTKKFECFICEEVAHA